MKITWRKTKKKFFENYKLYWVKNKFAIRFSYKLVKTVSSQKNTYF